MTIRDELLAIKDASPDSILYVQMVHDWARTHESSALYRALEWDEATAATEYRYSQIRKLIKLHVVSDDGAPLVVSLSLDRVASGGYRGVDSVVASRDLSAIMLRDALAELERVRSRYERVRELTAVWEEVEATRKRSRRRSVEAARPTA